MIELLLILLLATFTSGHCSRCHGDVYVSGMKPFSCPSQIYYISKYTKPCPNYAQLFNKNAIENEIAREQSEPASECVASPTEEQINQVKNMKESLGEIKHTCHKGANPASVARSSAPSSYPPSSDCDACQPASDIANFYNNIAPNVYGITVDLITCSMVGDNLPGNRDYLQTCGECVYIVSIPAFIPQAFRHVECMNDYCLSNMGGCVKKVAYPTVQHDGGTRYDFPFGKGCCCQIHNDFSFLFP